MTRITDGARRDAPASYASRPMLPPAVRLLVLLLCAAFLLAAVPSLASEARSRLLIDADTLAGKLEDPALVVLHLGDAETFAAGHVPGARLLPRNYFSRSRSGNTGSLQLELPDPAAFRMQMQQFGIARGADVVVVFGHDEITSATRVLWALESAGVADRVALLDGGLPEWKRKGLPLSVEPRAFSRTQLSPPGLQPLAVDLRFLRDRSQDVDFALLDARLQEYWSGNARSTYPSGEAPPGHLPGSRNLPYRSVLNADGRFKSSEELRRIFDAVGAREGRQVVVYCHDGLQASTVVYAARLIGLDAKLYDGSYEEWALLEMPLALPAAASR